MATFTEARTGSRLRYGGFRALKPGVKTASFFVFLSDSYQTHFSAFRIWALCWWGRRDLNPGPLACQASALTNWATPPRLLEARPGIEPGIRVLQTLALPLGHLALSSLERKTGFEPATLALARRCSTTEPLPLEYGAAGQNRTGDTRIFSPLLYQLSYRGKTSAARTSRSKMAEAMGFEPTVSCVTGTYVRPATPRLRD